MTEEQQSRNTPEGEYDVTIYHDWDAAQLELDIWKLSLSIKANDIGKRYRLEWELRNRHELQSQKNIRMFIIEKNFNIIENKNKYYA